MTTTPTPRTDAYFQEIRHNGWKLEHSWPEFARALERENAILRKALTESAQTFRNYEQMHLAKPDLDKAARNAEKAKLCEEALAEITP